MLRAATSQLRCSTAAATAVPLCLRPAQHSCSLHWMKRSAPISPIVVLGGKRQRLADSLVVVNAGSPKGTAGTGAPAGASNKRPASTTAAPSAALDKDALWLIVGLGNPGSNYERTRHNVGFMVVDELAQAYGIDCRKLEKSAAVGKGRIEGQQVLLVKPMTFMNNSGEAISALAKFYKIPSQRILVVSDDLDIPHAALRFRKSGGHGGHNGLRSIIERMGNTQDFPRIKIGIGRPAGQLPIATWVLQDFTRKEMEDMQVAVQLACDFVKSTCARGLEKALSEQAAANNGNNGNKQVNKTAAPASASNGGSGQLKAAPSVTPSVPASVAIATATGSSPVRPELVTVGAVSGSRSRSGSA